MASRALTFSLWVHLATLSAWFPAPAGWGPAPSAVPAGALGCPGSARPSSPKENLSGPKTEKHGSGRQRGQRGRPGGERQNPLRPHAGVLEEAAQHQNTQHLAALPAPPGDAPGSGSPKQAPSLPSASEAHADSRAPGRSLPQPPGPPGPRAALTPGTRDWAPPPRSPGPSASSALSLRAPASCISTHTHTPRPSRAPPGTHLRWGCSGGQPEPGGGSGSSAGGGGQRGAPGTAAAGRLVLPSRGPAQRYK